MVPYVGCGLLLASLAFPGALLAEVVFRCPSCTAERQEPCPKLTETCAEMVREPGCGCCPVSDRVLGKCFSLPLADGGISFPASQLHPALKPVYDCWACETRQPLAGPTPVPFGEAHLSVLLVWQQSRPPCLSFPGEVQDQTEASLTEIPPQKKPTNNIPWMDSKRYAVRAHWHDLKAKMKSNRPEEVKTTSQKLSQCQQELDQVLERISKMPFSENRGRLEDLYALHIPNCDKRGQYNLKQCKMSVHGQRGECWCVNPHTGQQIPGSPMVRGDPNCSQYFNGPETEAPVSPQK
ncbi:IGF binding protein 2 precursor-like [Scleropages formosus]|uniref:IGF binding protein 2-like n=1 Tax=Scleropages formosus TaxID=113540 RepID=A0A0N8K0L3_SCLFO|nr:IGF binding protein 2 precursor-like [Scleropages formosus]